FGHGGCSPTGSAAHAPLSRSNTWAARADEPSGARIERPRMRASSPKAARKERGSDDSMVNAISEIETGGEDLARVEATLEHGLLGEAISVVVDPVSSREIERADGVAEATV